MWHILAVVSLTAVAFCDQTKPPEPSKKDLKEAKSAFARGLKLQHSKHLDEALQEFNNAVELVPQNLQYLTTREMLRQQLVFQRMESGNARLRDGQQVEALANFRNALDLDPQNTYAQQRLRDVSGPDDKTELTQVLANSGELHVKPDAVHSDFHYRGDARDLITQIGKAYGSSMSAARGRQRPVQSAGTLTED